MSSGVPTHRAYATSSISAAAPAFSRGELIARGYRVVGVDASEAMLALARERLGPGVVLSRMTLPDLAVDGGFDAAVCTLDGLNYLTPDEFRLTMVAVAGCLRPAGWLVFDLHNDAMMNFTIANPTVAGQSAGNDFVISSVVDSGARTCDTRIEVTRASDGDSFSEQHRQYFHADGDVRASLQDAGFAVLAIEEEYTHDSADASALRATWTTRRPSV